MKMAGTMLRLKYLSKFFWKMVKATFGRTRFGEKSGQTGRSADMVQEMLGLCEAENGTHIDERLQDRASRH